jgi:hypothetical protein
MDVKTTTVITVKQTIELDETQLEEILVEWAKGQGMKGIISVSVDVRQGFVDTVTIQSEQVTGSDS